MPAKRYSVEQIVAKLRETEKLQAQGRVTPSSGANDVDGVAEETRSRNA